jgi:5-methylcytosine-specific restriction endonuclease McrA
VVYAEAWLAAALAVALKLRRESNLPVRTRERLQKGRLSIKERREAVRGGFATRPGSQVDKLGVLLVDDVLRTGATLDACARAFLDSGAKSLVAVTIARRARSPVTGPQQVHEGPSEQARGTRMSPARSNASESRGRHTPEATGAAVPGSESPAGSRPYNPITQRRASLMGEPVLVLNATYEPINVTAVRRAMVLMLKGVAQAEELHNSEVHSAAHAHKVPSVIRLLAYRHIPQQSRALSRKNILLRDRNTCQFCGRIFPSSELTLDHVVPRSRGGRSSWENLVACCYRCNNGKGDRTPEEAGLKLARRPRPFTLHTSRQLMRLIGHRDERWRKYLFY